MKARDFGLEGVVIKHVRDSLEDLDFKAHIIDNKLKDNVAESPLLFYS